MKSLMTECQLIFGSTKMFSIKIPSTSRCRSMCGSHKISKARAVWTDPLIRAHYLTISQNIIHDRRYRIPTQIFARDSDTQTPLSYHDSLIQHVNSISHDFLFFSREQFFFFMPQRCRIKK